MADQETDGRVPFLLVTRPPVQPVTSPPGRVVNLVTNYFRVQTDDTLSVYDFRVDFKPEIESVKLRRTLINQAADRFERENGETAFQYDGYHNLKALTQVNIGRETIVIPVGPVRIRSEGPAAGGGDEENGLVDQQIILKRAQNPVCWGSFEMMRFYNTVMRQNLHQHLKWMRILRHFYDPATEIRMDPYGISQVHGFATATNQHDGGILMSCDSISKILRHETAHAVMKNIFMNRLNPDDPAEFKLKCLYQMTGCVVRTIYGSKESYRIDDIDFGKTPKSKFDWRGREVDFVQYYEEQYGLTISDPRQPLLVKHPSAKTVRNMERKGKKASIIYLIPEFCNTTGLTEELKNDFNLKKQLTQSTQLTPQQRYDQLMKFRQTLENNRGIQSDLNAWNLSYSREPVHVQGRVLENENILTRTMVQPLQNPGDFWNEIRGNKMLSVKCWTAWAVLYTEKHGVLVNEFMAILKQVTAQLGLSPPNPRMIDLPDDRTATFVNALNQLPLAPDRLVLCVVSGTNKERYDAIKKKCYIDTPCTSQVVLTKTLARKQAIRAVAAKIALQMACKVGSVPWALSFKSAWSGSMVVGYDTYRDPNLKQSAGAFVSSLNPEATRYYSRASYHKDWTTMSENVANHLRDGLKEYNRRNGQLPKRVIMFRAGVGDGMIPHVFDVEVHCIRDVIDSFSSPIKLSVVIVSKRTGAKFFLKNGQQGVLQNPHPGTIVDSVVTRPERLEFFLVSQSVHQGTASPTNYNVICDNTGWQPTDFQQLAYKLCHLYYNWQGTIRVPAPCQYAHKLALMTCTTLHRDPSAALSDRLFFL